MSGAIARTAHILIANPSGPLSIHTATPADAPRLAPLLRAFGGPPDRSDGLAERIAACAGREVALLAEFEGETVGFAFVEVRPAIGDVEPRAELTDLYVRHEDRRRGIGRALMSAAEAHARASGADSLFLLTGHTNAGAKSFYGSLGYTDYALALHKALPHSSVE
jgi:ribosomal protein S18 acetylase RimI-like enzyme